MKRVYQYALFVVFIIFFQACTLTSSFRPDGEPSVPSDTESAEFQQAEQFLNQGSFEQAMAGYRAYLGQYPQGHYADQALNRIASIYLQNEDYDAAQAFYQRLIANFPDSPLLNSARLAIIDVLMLKHQTAEATKQALQMLETQPDDETRRQLWQRLARQYEEAGSRPDATAYGYLLYKTAPEAEKSMLAEQLQVNIDQLNLDDITKLWDLLDDPMARSYLMYHYAKLQIEGKNFDEALEVLNAFVKLYPDHRNIQNAREEISRLEDQLTFEPLTFGCLLPLTGAYKVYGQRALNGIELALSLFQNNDQTHPVKLVIKDSASNDFTAVKGVRELTAAGAGAIIGPIVTAPAAATEAQKLNIPMVTFTQKADITTVGDYIFRHFITPQSQVSALVDYFINTLGLQNFAILYPREAYGQTFMSLFWDEVLRQGGQIVGIETYDTQQTDFAETIKKLKGLFYPIPKSLQSQSSVQTSGTPYYVGAGHRQSFENLDEVLTDPASRLSGLYFQDSEQARYQGRLNSRHKENQGQNGTFGFDVLFVPDAPKTAALILPQLVYYDVEDIYLAGTNLWHSPQLIEMAGNYAQNAFMADGFFKESPLPTVQQFVDTYRQIYESEPGIIEAFAFDTAHMIINLLTQSNVRFRHYLRDSLLQASEPDGATGPLSFSQDGEAIKNLSLIRIKGKQFLEVPRQ